MIGKFIASLLLTGILVVSARAETDAVESPLSIRGFGTVGLARSSSDHAEFVRDLSQPVGIKGGKWSGRIDSILGLQANWRATHELEFVGQVVSRLHYDRSHNPEVMWAFAKWEPDPRYSFRAGRIGADFMMLADSRLVGYSYLPVRPSADFFGPLFFSHFDGADATATMPLGDGVLRGKVFGGWTQEKGAGALGTWDSDGSPVGGLVVEYTNGPWQIRGNYAAIRFAEDMNTGFLADPLRTIGTPLALAAVDTLRIKDTTSRFLSLGIVYDRGPLLVQGMLNRINHELLAFENSTAGYLLAGYRRGTLTPYVGLSWWKSKKRADLPDISAYTPLDHYYEQFFQGVHVDRTTYSLGMRWDWRDNAAVKLQWDAVRATSDTEFSLRNLDSSWNGRTNVISVTLDFIF